jgi:formylglycine-generating enzyme required for sulfatase activity
MHKLTIILCVGLLFMLSASAAGAADISVTRPSSVLRAFKDCEDCPEMAQIPAGSIVLGTATNDDSRQINNQDPAHQVNIGRYALSKTEITNAEFAAFVNATHYQAGDKCWTFENGSFEERAERDWQYPGFPAEDDHPATCLNVTDINAYAQWLSHKTGRQYRLPTEGEWAFAAEVGGSGVEPDNKHQQACVYANVAAATGDPQLPNTTWVVHSCTDGYSYSAPVRSDKPNALGLYDMTGNGWEWTQDCHEPRYNGAVIDSAPRSSTAWGSRDCAKNVLRGGSWYLDSQLARSTYRIWFEPTVRNFSYGFRLASSLP